MVEVSHDGAADDYGGKYVISTHTKAEAGADTLVDALTIDSAQNTKIGDGGTTNYTNISATGDMTFVGTAGLPHATIEGTAENVACTTQSQWYQCTFDTVGPENLAAGSAANNEIVISHTGHYMIALSACFHSTVSHDFQLMVKRANGTADVGVHLFQTTAVADHSENASGVGIHTLTAADTLEAWVMCSDAAGQTAEFDHINLMIVMVGA